MQMRLCYSVCEEDEESFRSSNILELTFFVYIGIKENPDQPELQKKR